MGWCHGLGWFPPGGILGAIGILLNLVFFIGLLVVLGLGIAWLVRRLTASAASGGRADSGAAPLDVARRRLAAGEISVAEFEEIRNRLHSG